MPNKQVFSRKSICRCGVKFIFRGDISVLDMLLDKEFVFKNFEKASNYLGVTRERVRQIINSNMNIFRKRYQLKFINKEIRCLRCRNLEITETKRAIREEQIKWCAKPNCENPRGSNLFHCLMHNRVRFSEYRKNNLEHCRKVSRAYQVRNKERIAEYTKSWTDKKLKEDPEYFIKRKMAREIAREEANG